MYVFCKLLKLLYKFLTIVDGKRPSLAFGVTGGKVLVHSPHETGNGHEISTPTVQFLNFNVKMTAIAAGKKFQITNVNCHNLKIRLSFTGGK